MNFTAQRKTKSVQHPPFQSEQILKPLAGKGVPTFAEKRKIVTTLFPPTLAGQPQTQSQPVDPIVIKPGGAQLVFLDMPDADTGCALILPFSSACMCPLFSFIGLAGFAIAGRLVAISIGQVVGLDDVAQNSCAPFPPYLAASADDIAIHQRGRIQFHITKKNQYVSVDFSTDN